VTVAFASRLIGGVWRHHEAVGDDCLPECQSLLATQHWRKDIHAFDFSPGEPTELLVELAAVVEAIDIEPHFHDRDEEVRTAEGVVKMHEGPLDPRSEFDAAFEPRTT
jgi:hypothetical protein